MVNNCDNLNVIAASQQFRGSFINNCKFSIFSLTAPVVESVKNLEITCYCFNFVHLKGRDYLD